MTEKYNFNSKMIYIASLKKLSAIILMSMILSGCITAATGISRAVESKKASSHEQMYENQVYEDRCVIKDNDGHTYSLPLGEYNSEEEKAILVEKCINAKNAVKNSDNKFSLARLPLWLTITLDTVIFIATLNNIIIP